MLRASESGIIDPEELADIRANTPAEIYLQEFECDFAVALQGAVYAKHLASIRAKGQIGFVPHDPGLPTWTFWDLGSPRNTAVWTVQISSGQLRFLHCDAAKDWDTGERVGAMLGRGYTYAGHILPHDGAAIQKGGITYAEELERAGLRNIRTIPRTTDPTARINRIIALMPCMFFDNAGCEIGLAAIEQYHRKFETKRGMFSDTPYHDWSSHPCDALGYVAEAIDGGMVQFGGVRKESKVISPIDGLGDGPGRVISALD